MGPARADRPRPAGGIGLVILVFAFGLPPGKPPVEVMLTIIAVVAASATLQASGGLEVMLQAAEKLLRRNPKYVSILAPFTTCVLTDVVRHRARGVHDAADHLRRGDQERHPAGAADGRRVDRQPDGHPGEPGFGGRGFAGGVPAKAPVGGARSLRDAAVDHHSVNAAGRAGDRHLQLVPRQGPGQGRRFQARIADPETRKRIYGDSTTLMGKQLGRGQWAAMWIFLGAIVVVAVLGAFEPLRPLVGRQAAVDDPHHPDVHAAGRRLDHRVYRDRSGRHRKERSVPRRHDRRDRRVRDRVDGRHRVRSQPAGPEGRIVRSGEGPSLGLCAGAAAGVQAGQLAGRRNQRDGAGGPGDRRAARLCGRVRRGQLRLLHPADLSERPGDDPVRPLGHHASAST